MGRACGREVSKLLGRRCGPCGEAPCSALPRVPVRSTRAGVRERPWENACVQGTGTGRVAAQLQMGFQGLQDTVVSSVTGLPGPPAQT